VNSGPAGGPAGGPADELLRAVDLRWEVDGQRILGPVEVDVEQGECVAIVGPNGAGKTTLLRLLVGVLTPSGGTVAWRGDAYSSLTRRELAMHIAYVPQIRPARVPFTVDQVVLLGRHPYLSALQLAPTEADFAAVARALEVVELSALRERQVDELSGGERQAVYVAAALAQETEVLVLDEPTTHLDPRHQRRIAGILRRLVREEGKTVVMATHDLNLAARVAGRVVALAAGRGLASGTPAEMLRPGPLERLFAAPFDLVRDGDRPVTVLDLDA